ncbi:MULTISPECIES: hypothetical protein [unclassified Bradyrhizobium]|uniref:hypothetical protein n=1 Tax=unclassified Bradyrhizobium TaxID=2631580 RepID=UPI001FF9AFA8|nr:MULTISPECIES: hypothetical protein [unclassified Bradyrhizobium]
MDIIQVARARSRRTDVIGVRQSGRASRRKSFIVDQRGAAAFEMMIVYVFLVSTLLMPLADVAAAGFRFVAAWEALRGFGQRIQYNPPQDVTDWASWKSALPTSVSGYPINNLQVVCSDTMADCSAANFLPPKHYTYTTTVTVAPIVLRSVICRSGNADPCSFTLPYAERFQ